MLLEEVGIYLSCDFHTFVHHGDDGTVAVGEINLRYT